MSGEHDTHTSEQRLSLPKPDVKNITVLTRNLPNDPVLPWHRFNSPWLETTAPETATDTDAEATADRGADETEVTPAGAEQLTLDLPDPTAADSASSC